MKKMLYFVNKVSQKKKVEHPDSISTINCFVGLGYKVYCADWFDVSDGLIISYILDPVTGQEFKDMGMNEISDIALYRSIGSVELRIFDFQRHLINVKEKYSGIVINNIEAMLFGVRKDYLLFLQNNNFPVIPSKGFSRHASLEELKDQMFNENEEENIIKPITGECGNSFYILKDLTNEILDYKRNKVGGWILQPLLKEVLDGEISLIMIGGEVSHAVRKKPSGSDFRVNDRWVDLIYQINPPEEVIGLAKEIYDKWPFRLLTFRLDAILSSEGYKIMEVETVNPGFYQSHIKDSKLPILLLNQKLLA